MPQPVAVDEVAERLVARYQEAIREWQQLVESTARLTPAKRLRELQQGVDRILGALDADVRDWITTSTPQVWSMGATAATGAPFPLQAHLPAIQAMAAQNYSELLSATRHVAADTKRALRTLARGGALDVLGGQTANRAGLDLTNARQDAMSRVMTVTYRNGAVHSLADWADTAVRTQTALAYNDGAIGAMRATRIKWVEIADGPACIMPDQTFMPYGELRGLSRARFAGPGATRITAATEAGTRQLTVGPNHPVLTRSGFKPARLLDERDELVYDLRLEDPLRFPELHLEKVPAVQDVFAALKCGGVAVARVRGDDLHGDGHFCQGEIEVVGPVWELLPVADPRFVEHPGERDFVFADAALPFVAGLRCAQSHGVSFARIVRIERFRYEGPVFDAETSNGTFSANGFVVKNCGLTAHDDPELANGLVVPIETAEAYPLAHPRCARSLLPRGDLDSEEAAQAANDARDMNALEAMALEERERAAQRTVTGRRMTVASEERRVARRERAGRTERPARRVRPT